MHVFDYSLLKETVPAKMIGVAEIIGDLRAKEEVRKLQYVETFDALRERAVIESVGASNAIEGIVTTEDRLASLVEGDTPHTHEESEISGYKDALDLIHNRYDELDFDTGLIRQFHRMIMEGSDPAEAGEYKKNNNLILETDESGKRRVRFRPIGAELTPEAMEQLVLAYIDASQDAEVPRVFLIASFVLDFLCIHPFRDGNGRVSRLLAVFLLYRKGYDIGRFISIEKQIEKYKDAYYTALRQSSEGWMEQENDYMPFAVFLMQILYRCYRELDERFVDISLKKASKKERVESLLMNSFVPISKREIVEKLPDISVKTVDGVLAQMMREGRVVKIGTYKDARYKRK